MKNKRSVITILGISLLIVIAYFVPTIVTVFEDNRLRTGTTGFAIEEIELSTADWDIVDKLANFPEALLSSKVVQQSATETVTDLESTENQVVEFLSLFNNGKTVFLKKISVTSLVLVDSQMDMLYQMYECRVIDLEENEYVIWIDQVTETVMAFHVSGITVEAKKENLYMVLGGMAEYYGYLDSEIREDKLVLISELGETINLPYYIYEDRWYFNMIPVTQTDSFVY